MNKPNLLLSILVNITAANWNYKVIVNNKKPDLKIQENTEKSDIALFCRIEYQDRKGEEEVARRCQENPDEGCPRVSWYVQNFVENPEGNRAVIARKTSDQEMRVLSMFSSRFVTEPQYNLRIQHPVLFNSFNGTYTCKVELDLYSMSEEASFDVIVQVPVTKVWVTGEEEPVLGSPTTLKCNHNRAVGPPTIKWFFDGDEIERQRTEASDIDQELHSTFKLSGQELIIDSVQKMHDGKYSCTAKNSVTPEAVTSDQAFVLKASKIDKVMVMYVAIGAGVVISLIVLMIFCCCCGKSKKKKSRTPHVQYDEYVGQNVQFTAGRQDVNPARSQPSNYYPDVQSHAFSQENYGDQDTMVKTNLDSTYNDYNQSEIRNNYDGY